MKRKNYLHFALPRVIAGLLAAAVIFGISFAYLQNSYNIAIDEGFLDREEIYGRLIENYAEDTYDATFIDIFTQFYTADYFRLAEVKEDGSLKTITESNYGVIPVEDDLQSWYFVTKDEALLSQGKRSVQVNNNEFVIEYKKCDEIWDISNLCDKKIANSWDLAEMSGGTYYSNALFQLTTYISGSYYYSRPSIRTFYLDGDTLHLGKVYEERAVDDGAKLFGKSWDFTDPANADKYKNNKLIDGEEYDNTLQIFNRAVRPDGFLSKNGDIFLADNTADIRSAFQTHDGIEDDEYYYVEYRKSSESSFTYKITSKYMNPDYSQGFIKLFEHGGRQFLMEYVITTVSFKTFAKPFLIVWSVFLLVLCLVIALIVALFPYLKYKKAYETNTFKNNLIDSLAHNMKTPLQILGGYAENLKDVKSDADKDHYADQILAKTAEMNKDIEAILKTAEKSDLKLNRSSVRACVEAAAKKVGADIIISGDREMKMDKDYFSQAIFCLIDNAYRYKAEGATIDVKIDKNDIV
ncbi:MAG: HAMP domain-containing histidine kinase, partial [Clostridiales bacterium]|nr:HAMP domain-containing histidine kinase [Clostridiales bacterium]